jgi:hypothetical protein
MVYRIGVTANDYWPAAATMPVYSPVAMTYAVADRLFRSGDDLNFDLPSDANQRPKSVSGTLQPDYTGDYSWIATISHTPADINNNARMHRFDVSVVVMQKRDPTLWASGLEKRPPSERLVFAKFLQYGGQPVATATPFYGGGSLQLYVYDNQNTSNPNQSQPNFQWLNDIKPNTYLMLSANFIDGNAAFSNTPYPRLGWYRILNVDDGPNQDPNNNSLWTRTVTVAGADWPSIRYLDPQLQTQSQLWICADSTVANGINSPPVVFCTLMDDAVAEYQETITLDYSLVRE